MTIVLKDILLSDIQNQYNVGGGINLLGLLCIPRSTPVPWIKDNAILALPDNVLTYVVLCIFS
jgi:hypothetical protein